MGDVHTNYIKGIWRPFKRSIGAAFHKVSEKPFDRSLDELEWRYNNWDDGHIFVDTLRRIVNADTLTHHRLTA